VSPVKSRSLALRAAVGPILQQRGSSSFCMAASNNTCLELARLAPSALPTRAIAQTLCRRFGSVSPSPRPPDSDMCSTAEHALNGSWQWRAPQQAAGLPYLVQRNALLHSDCDASQQRWLETAELPRYQQYQWRPFGCSLPSVDAGSLCAALQKKTITFVGDSTMAHFAHAALGTLTGYVPNACDGIAPERLVKPCSEDNRLNHADVLAGSNSFFVRVCAGQARLRFVRVDSALALKHPASLRPIAAASDYLVINFGVHWSEAHAQRFTAASPPTVPRLATRFAPRGCRRPGRAGQPRGRAAGGQPERDVAAP